MKIKLSLRQIWTFIVLVAVIVPVVIVMVWYGSTLYKHELKSALKIERMANEHLKNLIESEIRRFKTLLRNRSDPLSFLASTPDNPENIKQISSLMELVIERESAVHGIMLLSMQGEVIAAIDPGLNYSGNKILSEEEKSTVLKHWGFENVKELPEFVIPSLGRTYISSLMHHPDETVFKIAVSVGMPVIGVLILELGVEEFLLLDKRHKYSEHGLGSEVTRDYILDRRGVLITGIEGSEKKHGELMTYIPIVRTALIGAEWPTDISYIGVTDQPVYGTLTNIPSLNWTLVSEVIESNIINPIWKSLLELFLVTLVAMVIFIWLIMRLVKTTLVPIQHAREAIDHVARGDYDYKLEPTGVHELDDMIYRITNMTKARQVAEISLQESEQDLLITLNSIGDAVIACDANGFVTRMNPVAERLTGWSITGAYGRFIKSIFSIVNETTREPIDNPVDKVLTTGETVHLSDHTTLISKDGSEYQIADSAAPIRNENGKILGMVLVFNDVTEQYKLRKSSVESEERFSQLAENVNEVFWIGSPDWHKVFYISPAYEKVWGQSAEGLYQNPRLWLEAVYPEDRDQVIADIPQDINNIGEYVEFKNYRIQTKDGKILWIKARAYPIHDQDGKVVRIAGIAEDITEQVGMEESLRRSQKMDALGKLTGGIAHDYNNMLGVVLGYAELLEGALIDQPKLAGYVSRINKAGMRGAKLTKKLLSFSRQKNIDAQCVDINELLNDMQHMLEKTLTVRVKLKFDLQGDLWPVWLSSDDMEDVVLNVTINAMHAIEGNGVLTIQSNNEYVNSVDAKLVGLQNEGEYVRLSISDTGCGMDEVTKEKIFDPFFTTKGEKGTGLGLSQVYGFVSQNKGAIKVYTELGNGTKFVFYFPRYQESDNKKIIIEKIKESESRGNETILVVDDEVSLLELSCEMLSMKNYKVFSAENAKQALEILQTEHVDLMLSDVIMPEMNGFELAEIVQKKYPDIKIQLASGFTDKRNSDDVDATLQSELLRKPFNSQNLLQKIRSLLDSKKISVKRNTGKLSVEKDHFKSVEWNEQLSVGLPQIDNDHKKLFSLFNRCAEAMESCRLDEKKSRSVLDELVEYTEHHCKREEELMKVCGYPGMSQHQKIHQELLEDIKQQIVLFDNEELTEDELLIFLSDWLVGHIMHEDKAMAAYFEGKENKLNQILDNEIK
ncbi:MAG: hypothetical protein DIZ80_11100 [endosymbiont of Galathealinum brachiosum]|uniref:histidine kinase n=1 Tax=endosymbiont of Galathealinum brachiosum TaxID=2200906 RepID=A0A370DD81_9GAMM|nr:MAG: hypothetical protein DIZ80_11100 [endosymbiont of Galathealinum brachiosum]